MKEASPLYDDSSSLAYTAYERSNMTVHVELPLAHYLVDQGIIQKSLLDYGCGSGSFARVFARRGCTVVGVDASESQIALARAAETSPHHSMKVQYQVVDSSGSGKLGSFDTVWMAWVLVMISTKDEVLGLLQNAFDNLGSHGTVVVLTFLVPESDPERRAWKQVCAKEGLMFDLLGASSDDPFETRFTYQDFSVPNFYLSKQAYHDLLTKAGFDRVEFVPATVSAEQDWVDYAARCACTAVVGYKS